MRKSDLPETVASNIGHLVEIRDAAIHLTASSPNLPHLVFMLGSASLRNYSRLYSKWFNKSLAHYNFYVMPLAFSAPCQRLELLDRTLDTEEISAILDSAKASNTSLGDCHEFNFICEIQAELVSAKKASNTPDVVVAIDQGSNDTTIVHKPVHALDRYPLSAKDVAKRVRESVPWATQKDVWTAIKALKIKGDARYSKYSYPTKSAEIAGPSKSIGVIYNADAVRLLSEYLRNRGDPPGDSSV
jgi:hypothetical protein